MQLSISITAGPDDTVGDPNEIAQTVLDALDLDPEKDHVSVILMPQPVQGMVGTPPPPPPAPEPPSAPTG
jgi:hypothetical protein